MVVEEIPLSLELHEGVVVGPALGGRLVHEHALELIRAQRVVAHAVGQALGAALLAHPRIGEVVLAVPLEHERALGLSLRESLVQADALAVDLRHVGCELAAAQAHAGPDQVDRAVVVLERAGVDAAGALHRVLIDREGAGRRIRHRHADAEAEAAAASRRVREVEVILAVLLHAIRRPHRVGRRVAPGHVLLVHDVAVVGPVRQVVGGVDVVVGHAEPGRGLPLVVHRGDVVRRIQVQAAVEDVGRRVGGELVGNHRVGTGNEGTSVLEAHLVQEVRHVSEVPLGVHVHPVAAALDEVQLGADARLVQQFIEMRALAVRDHVVFRTVEDDHGRVGRVDVGGGVQGAEALLVPLEGEAHHGLFRGVVPGVLGGAAAHVIEVHGAGPVAGGIHTAAEAEVAAHGAFQFRHAAARRGQRGKVAAGGETGGGHEGRVEAVLGGVGPHEADHALDVVDLRRELGVGGGTVVRGHDRVARVQQGVHDGAEVRHPLGIVGEPGASVDMDHHGIDVFLHAGQVDVHLVIDLVVARVVDVRELLGAVDVDLGHLEAAETAGGLGLEGAGARQADGEYSQELFHFL